MTARLVFALFALASLTLSAGPGETKPKSLPGTVDQLLDLAATPFAIAHRGFGENVGEDPSGPIENTVPAVRKGFAVGATVVEVDVQQSLGLDGSYTNDVPFGVEHQAAIP